MSKHTPGQLGYNGIDLYIQTSNVFGGRTVAVLRSIGSPMQAPLPMDANGERLADCWNACDGLEDPRYIPELIEACRHILGSEEKRREYLPIVSGILARLDGRTGGL